MLLDLTVVSFKYLESFKLVSSAFVLLFTEISVVRGTKISVKSSAKADETSFNITVLWFFPTKSTKYV